MFNSYLANYQRVSDFFKHAKWEQSCSPILRPLGTLLWIGSLNGTIWDMNIITNIPFNIWMFFQGTNRISRCVYINELHGYISVFSFVAIDWMYSKSLRTIILYVSIQDWPCFFCEYADYLEVSVWIISFVLFVYEELCCRTSRATKREAVWLWAFSKCCPSLEELTGLIFKPPNRYEFDHETYVAPQIWKLKEIKNIQELYVFQTGDITKFWPFSW